MTLLAPNGKPSNLTPEQYKLVRTKSFKEWFGDWENDPKNASKVVDENGEPLVVYRTTKKEDYHNDFLKNKYVFGIYFSEDKNSTNIYGKFTKEYFLNIKNPKLLRGIKYDEMWVYSIITKDKYKNLKDNNNDGAIWKRQNVFYELVVFEPNQIKLADGTNTTFDSNNPDIRFDEGGWIEDYGDYQIEIKNEYEYIVTALKNGKRVGLLTFLRNPYTSKNGELYILVDIINVNENERGYGLATKMYEYALKHLPKKYKGIASDLKNRVNKNEIPKIYSKFNNKIESWGGVEYHLITNPDIRFDGGGSVLLAPNGKPSNLTPEQYKLVRTKAFKDWFGDWENEPENASKVVDENGEPMVCYHGTKELFNKFKKQNTYFTDSKKYIKSLIGKDAEVKEVFINSKKVCDLTSLGFREISFEKFTNECVKQGAKKNYADYEELEDYVGNDKYMAWQFFRSDEPYLSIMAANWLEYFFDVIIYKNSGLQNAKSKTLLFISSRKNKLPNQIKLADGTNTTFDGSNPDIRFAKGGDVKKNVFMKEKPIQSLYNYLEKNSYTYLSYSEESNEGSFEINYKGRKFIIGKLNNMDESVEEMRESTFDYYLRVDGNEVYDQPNLPKKFIEFISNILTDLKSKGKFEDGDEVFLAPNGKPSNLTPEQYKLVRTPAFKKWFGDWENDPENASKVVDSNGEPLVVRHFSQKSKKFFIFDEKSKKNEWSVSKEGFYFTSISAKELEDAYNRTGKGVLYEVFLNIKNLLDLGIYDTYDFITNKPVFWKNHHFEMIGKYVKADKYGDYSDYSEFDKKTDYTAIQTISKEHKNKLIKLGYNGIWGNKSNDIYETIDEIVAFYPNQIKLADGTNTTFDSNNTDIRYKNGGLTMKKTKAKLLAPNGKPSNLTPEQYKLVRTPAFKKWFGDWENEPENASKVVDENGEPLVVWHTSPNYFNTFDSKKSVKGLFHFGTISQAIDRLTYYIETVGFDLTPYIKLTTEQDEEMFEIDIYWKLVNYILLLNFYDKNDVDVYFENIFNSRQKEFIKNIKINIDKNKIKSEIDKYNIKPYFLRVKKLGKTNDVGENWQLDSSFFDGYMYINLHEGNKKEHSFTVFNPNQIKLADGSNTTFDTNNPDIRFEGGGIVNFVNSKSLTIKIGGDLYKVQYRRNELGDTDKNVWFADVVSKNGERIDDGRLCYDDSYYNVIYGFSLYEVEKDIIDTFKKNDLHLITKDDYGIEIENRHIEFSNDSNNINYKYEEGGLIDDIFVEDMYSVVIDGDSYHDIIYDGKDYDYALYRYNSIEPDDFLYPNGSHNHKLLMKYFIKYKFVGEVEDGNKISDYIDYLNDSDYWEVIEKSEWEELISDDVAAVNKRTDEIIDEIRDFINSKYVHSRYGSKYMDIYVYDDEDNEIDYITIRVADHSQNPRNRTHEHHISFVIANKNETKDRFRSRDEYYYDDDDDIEGIKSEIESIIDEKIEEIKQERYEQGGILNNLFIYNIGGL